MGGTSYFQTSNSKVIAQNALKTPEMTKKAFSRRKRSERMTPSSAAVAQADA